MLKHTFLHLPGIGRKKEQALWQQGVRTWEDFERRFLSQRTFFPTGYDAELIDTLNKSREALEKGDLDFFAERLPKQEQYRIALAAPETTVFLDIESTGLSLYYDQTTIIGASDLDRYHVYVSGDDLSPIVEMLASATCIVTFNGTLFDLKFLQKGFPELRIPKAHVDLRYFARSVGLAGPQKDIERLLKLTREEGIQSIVGEKAPLLWYRYSRGDLFSGKQLVQYNYADIEGMKFIFDAVVHRLLDREPIFAGLSKAPRFFVGSRHIKWASSTATATRGRIYLPEYRGRVGPQIVYRDLVTDDRSRKLRIVGIDLTGSAARPTGWCLLEGSHATTTTLSTDVQLIKATLAARPDLVSIDSPLSLPKGRKTVGDDDPGRNKFGIMRACERTLKKRGVNVYPCLIRSMQNLTARGIRLAKKFREMGIPVIESYPGAAQDIIGIPRKRASLDYLKQGLGEFGISGQFLAEKVTHDEVDAVTAAIVGLFFWSGKFEALGNEDEEYLIVPDLLIPPDPWRGRLVVGMSGPIAAGKTTGAKFLEQGGFAYGRYSQVLAELLLAKGIKPTREALQAFGDRIHRRPGQRWLSRQLVRRLPADRNLVIDGLRFPEDHAALVEAFGPAFIHVHVEASEATRRARYVDDGHPVTEFDRAIRHGVETKIPRLGVLAQVRIVNELSKRAYREELRQVIRSFAQRTELEAQYGGA